MADEEGRAKELKLSVCTWRQAEEHWYLIPSSAHSIGRREGVGGGKGEREAVSIYKANRQEWPRNSITTLP